MSGIALYRRSCFDWFAVIELVMHAESLSWIFAKKSVLLFV